MKPPKGYLATSIELAELERLAAYLSTSLISCVFRDSAGRHLHQSSGCQFAYVSAETPHDFQLLCISLR